MQRGYVRVSTSDQWIALPIVGCHLIYEDKDIWNQTSPPSTHSLEHLR
ncbi:Uncharacterised protein [Yersinia frederiksenii]|nr:Uncharacterised protein [Yersinia frederiksenii]